MLALKGEPEVMNIPLLMGPVGLGKSSMGRDLAQEFFLRPVFINSGECSDSTDISGMPSVTLTGQEMGGIPYTRWSLNEQAALACNEPVLLIFDDIDKAQPFIQNALLGVFGARTLRSYTLHPGTLVMAAGNRVGDDEYANTLSESLRTRLTPYELIPSVTDFSEYAIATGEIHPVIIGYLQFNPKALHSRSDTGRFPSPRGWREVSRHFGVFPDPMEVPPGSSEPAWKGIVGAKCGSGTGNDFWAWYTVLSTVDVKGILAGTATTPSGDAKRVWEYAATFAMADHLNRNGFSKKDVGIEKFIKDIGAEMRVAFAIQLTPKSRADLATLFPSTAAAMVAVVTKTSKKKAAPGV